MSKINDSVGFYRKMSDLQEKLRRSEEERLQLEEKFTLLMRACRDEEEIRLNMLREKYEKFLEEEKTRKERNERILLTLERIESRANILTAKSERLRLLRRHYEAYLMRTYPKWKYITEKYADSIDLETLKNVSYNGLDGKVLPASFHPELTKELPSGHPLQHYDSYSSVRVPKSYQLPSAEERIVISTPVARPFSTPIPFPPLLMVADSNGISHKEVKLGENLTPQQIPARPQETLQPDKHRVEGTIGSRTNTQIANAIERASELLNVKADDSRWQPLSRPVNNANDVSKKHVEQQPKEYTNSELEQNTSGDLLNISLSDDGILQKETHSAKNESLRTPQSEDTYRNKNLNYSRGQAAGGDVLHMGSRATQKTGAAPYGIHHGGGDFGLQQSGTVEQNQRTQPNKSIHQLQGQSHIQKQYSQQNKMDQPQYASRQHLQQHGIVHPPQVPMIVQQQSKTDMKQHVSEEQTLPILKEQINDQYEAQKAETFPSLQERVISKDYSDKDQKQCDPQYTEQNFNEQYDQQYAGMQEIQNDHPYEQEFTAQMDQQYSEQGHLGQQEIQNDHLYDQEFSAQMDQQYSEQGHLGQQYDLQYSEQSKMNQEYDQQYVEQDQLEQQYDLQYSNPSQTDQQYNQQYAEQEYYEQYPEQGETIQQYDQQYTEQIQMNQQYDQQYLEPNQSDQLYDQQYGVQGPIKQNYIDPTQNENDGQYGENQQGYLGQDGSVYTYDDQQNDGNVHYGENQQYSTTVPPGKVQEYEHQHNAQEQNPSDESNEQNLQYMPQVQNMEQFSEHVMQEQEEQQQHQEEQQEVQQHHQEEQHQLPQIVQQQQQEGQEQQMQQKEKEKEEDQHRQLQQKKQEGQQQQLNSKTLQYEEQNKNPDVQKDSQQEQMRETKSEMEQKHKQPEEHQNAFAEKQPEVGIEEYRRLLGETGEIETSETDELEVQLAALVEPKINSTKEEKKTNEQPKDGTDKSIPAIAKPVAKLGNEESSSSDTGENIPPLPQETNNVKLKVEGSSALEKQPKEEGVTPVPKIRPASKRLPVLNKVLESDSESLQLDVTPSNAESDDFDFSSEQQ